jgi:hypothetical protein
MAVALILYILGNVSYTRALVVHIATVLCPEMYLGLAQPTSAAAITLLLAWVFGTNFLLYGLVGTALCGGWSLLYNGRRNSRVVQPL